ncbi:MAG: HipA domain-containing protein [Bacteroidales bacterium]|nr:HipA domain-containing protein [Bacteroidales bacterium]
MHTRKHIKALKIKDFSGFNPKHSTISFVKRHQYFIVPNIAITGDAPKDFIRYYHYGEGRKSNTKAWPLFIAKLGHKHYPMESITEHLLTRIGEVLGFSMAKSELAWLGGQVRFLSRYFLNKLCEQTLDHGADLYAGYLNDRAFVEEIEKVHQSPNFFTVQFTSETLMYFFPNEHNELFKEFLKLIVFDALIGNNDRHFYNWAIIRNIQGKDKPVFSPIYDTARGLFWNVHEDKLNEVFSNKTRINSFIKKYCEESTPKIGWDGVSKLNHFDLVEFVKSLPITITCQEINSLCQDESLEKVFTMIDKEFTVLLSPIRKEMIKLCLRYRHDRIKKIF